MVYMFGNKKKKKGFFLAFNDPLFLRTYYNITEVTRVCLSYTTFSSDLHSGHYFPDSKNIRNQNDLLISLKFKFPVGWKYLSLRRQLTALAGVAQCIEGRPANHKVASWIPSQSTHLGCRPGPQ